MVLNAEERTMLDKTVLLIQPLPYNSDPRSDRTHVPLLNTDTATHRRAHAHLVDDWLTGKVGSGAPSDQTDVDMIRVVNDLPVQTRGASHDDHLSETQGHADGDSTFKQDEDNPSELGGESNPGDHIPKLLGGTNDEVASSEMDSETQCVYDELVERKVPKLLQVATSHRGWIRKTYEFFKMVGVQFSERMEYLVRIHDLSKYTDREVLGYAVMFGGGQNGFRKLEDETEKAEWDTAVEHHYISNPHHPEYFYPRRADGTRDKSRAMPDIDQEHGQEYLDESLIDMLASKGERVLKDDEEFSVSKWMDIQERFMSRYGEQDKAYVLGLTATWRQMALMFLETDGNKEQVNGHFDQRAVVM